MKRIPSAVRIVAAVASVLISAALLGSVVIGMTSTDYASVSISSGGSASGATS